jgi:hypothetical protein
MMISLLKRDELAEMRESIRRNINALEYCWSCQWVSECKPEDVDDGSPVWLCGECAASRQPSSVSGTLPAGHWFPDCAAAE